MTDTGVAQGTRTMRLRAVFNSSDKLTLWQAQDHLVSIGGLVYVGSLLTYAADDAGRIIGGSSTTAHALDDLAKRDVEGVTVQSISYNSPLEVVLAITSGTGSVVMLGAAMVGLWERVQQARVTTSRSKLVLAATRMLIHDLENHRVSTGDLRKQSHVDLLLDAAAAAAVDLTTLRVEED